MVNRLKVQRHTTNCFATFTAWTSQSDKLHETHKSTGAAKDEVSELFKKFIEIQFIEVVPSKEFAFVIKKMMSLEEIKTSIENS